MMHAQAFLPTFRALETDSLRARLENGNSICILILNCGVSVKVLGLCAQDQFLTRGSISRFQCIQRFYSDLYRRTNTISKCIFRMNFSNHVDFNRKLWRRFETRNILPADIAIAYQYAINHACDVGLYERN
jgi:hypothetical protein